MPRRFLVAGHTDRWLRSICCRVGYANPPCGSDLLPGCALWRTNLYGPWPLPSAGGKGARSARLYDERRRTGITPTPIATPVDLDGVQIRYFPCPLLRRLYWSPALGRALRHEIGEFRIVHLHSVFLWPTWAAARAARNAGVPYVLSPRGMLVKDLIARRSRLAKSAWIRLIERSNVEQAAALHLTSQLESYRA